MWEVGDTLTITGKQENDTRVTLTAVSVVGSYKSSLLSGVNSFCRVSDRM